MSETATLSAAEARALFIENLENLNFSEDAKENMLRSFDKAQAEKQTEGFTQAIVDFVEDNYPDIAGTIGDRTLNVKLTVKDGELKASLAFRKASSASSGTKKGIGVTIEGTHYESAAEACRQRGIDTKGGSAPKMLKTLMSKGELDVQFDDA